MYFAGRRRQAHSANFLKGVLDKEVARPPRTFVSGSDDAAKSLMEMTTSWGTVLLSSLLR